MFVTKPNWNLLNIMASHVFFFFSFFFYFSVDAKISASLALSIHLNENCKKTTPS